MYGKAKIRKYLSLLGSSEGCCPGCSYMWTQRELRSDVQKNGKSVMRNLPTRVLIHSGYFMERIALFYYEKTQIRYRRFQILMTGPGHIYSTVIVSSDEPHSRARSSTKKIFWLAWAFKNNTLPFAVFAVRPFRGRDETHHNITHSYGNSS